MKIAIIFGASGQDGPYLGNQLLAMGYKVVGTHHPLENIDVAESRAEGIDWVGIDVTDPLAVRRLINAALPDEIYYLAAISATRAAETNPYSAISANFVPIVNIIDLLRSSHPPVKLFHASSAAIFGFARGDRQREDTPKSPANIYALTKLAAHEYVRLARENWGVQASNGILFNHESIWRPTTFVTAKLANAAAAHAPVTLYGSLDSIRDWGAAQDYAVAMVKICQAEWDDDFCVGTGDPMTVGQWGEYMFEKSGLDFKSYVDAPDSTRSDALVANPTYLMSTLHWEPKIPRMLLMDMMYQAQTMKLRGEAENLVSWERNHLRNVGLHFD